MLWEVEVKDGDIGAAVEKSIADVCEAMRPINSEEVEDSLYVSLEELGPQMLDVALACGGRIWAVVRVSSNGPAVNRFTGDSSGPNRAGS